MSGYIKGVNTQDGAVPFFPAGVQDGMVWGKTANGWGPMSVKAVSEALPVSKFGLPVLELTGDTTAMTKDNAVDLRYVYGDLSGTCSVKWQGSSSIQWPKKNYTVKFDQAFEAFPGWGAQKKYCMKANFIDHSHARNVVSAKLWGQIVRTRTFGNLFDPAKITGLVNYSNGSDQSSHISVAGGVVTSGMSTVAGGVLLMTGQTFPSGKYKISFEVYNPNNADTDPVNRVVVALGAQGVAYKSAPVQLSKYGAWEAGEAVLTVTADDNMLGLQPNGQANEIMYAMGYQFRNIRVVNAAITTHERLTELPNCGAVDGFPCIITLNGEFHGLYTWNIPKDGWMMAMGSGTQEAILCADDHTSATRFEAEATLDGDFELEYVSDEENSAWVKTSVNRLINAVAASDGTDLDTTIAQYLDWESAIDYYIFTVLIGGDDMLDKNYILATYDGTRWFFTAYDMDTTYGLSWDGTKFKLANASVKFAYYADYVGGSGHKLMHLIRHYKTDELKSRYTKIRQSIMHELNLDAEFENFGSEISAFVMMEDLKKWPSIPSSAVSNIEQIRNWYRLRIAVIDSEVSYW